MMHVSLSRLELNNLFLFLMRPFYKKHKKRRNKQVLQQFYETCQGLQALEKTPTALLCDEVMPAAIP